MVGLRFPQALVLMVPGTILLLGRVLKAESLAFFGQL